MIFVPGNLYKTVSNFYMMDFEDSTSNFPVIRNSTLLFLGYAEKFPNGENRKKFFWLEQNKIVFEAGPSYSRPASMYYKEISDYLKYYDNTRL